MSIQRTFTFYTDTTWTRYVESAEKPNVWLIQQTGPNDTGVPATSSPMVGGEWKVQNNGSWIWTPS